MSYSEVADPLSKMDDYVTKIIEKATSKQERKKSYRKIKDLVDHMKPQWNRMMDAVARYEKKEKDLDDLVREAKERKALMKFRHVISVFREIVCGKLDTEWKKIHLLLHDKDEVAIEDLTDVLGNTFRMSMKEWDTLSEIARKGSKVAHPTFENDEEISGLLKALPDSVGDEDRGVLQKLTSKVIEEWECRMRLLKDDENFHTRGWRRRR